MAQTQIRDPDALRHESADEWNRGGVRPGDGERADQGLPDEARGQDRVLVLATRGSPRAAASPSTKNQWRCVRLWHKIRSFADRPPLLPRNDECMPRSC